MGLGQTLIRAVGNQYPIETFVRELFVCKCVQTAPQNSRYIGVADCPIIILPSITLTLVDKSALYGVGYRLHSPSSPVTCHKSHGLMAGHVHI